MCLILYLSIKIGHLYFKIRQGREEFRFFPSISVLLAPSTCPFRLATSTCLHHYFQASLGRLGTRHQTTRKQIFGCLIKNRVRVHFLYRTLFICYYSRVIPLLLLCPSLPGLLPFWLCQPGLLRSVSIPWRMNRGLMSWSGGLWHSGTFRRAGTGL